MLGVGVAAPNRVALGENSRMLVGGGPNGADGWWIRFVTGTADVTPTEIRTTDNMSMGFGERTRGERDCAIMGDIFWRAADNPIGNGPQFQEGEDTPKIILWPDFLNAPNQYFKLPVGWCAGYGSVTSGPGETRGTIRLLNQGPYYTPSRPDPRGAFA